MENSRFKDIDTEALSDICIGNYKEYLESKEYNFDTFKEAIDNGVIKSDLIFAFFNKLFDQNENEIKGFEVYLIELMSKLLD